MRIRCLSKGWSVYRSQHQDSNLEIAGACSLLLADLTPACPLYQFAHTANYKHLISVGAVKGVAPAGVKITVASQSSILE